MSTHQTVGESDDEQEAEAFFESLAGRGHKQNVGQKMRVFVLSESLACRTGHQPDRSQKSAIRDAETFSLLINEGVFVEAHAVADRLPRRSAYALLARWRQGLDQFFAVRSVPALASLAAIAFLLVLVSGLEPDATGPQDVLRGGTQHSVVVADAEAFAQSLANELHAAGATARLVQVNDLTWSLTVTVQQPILAEAAVAVLEERGLRTVTHFPVEVLITTR